MAPASRSSRRGDVVKITSRLTMICAVVMLGLAGGAAMAAVADDLSTLAATPAPASAMSAAASDASPPATTMAVAPSPASIEYIAAAPEPPATATSGSSTNYSRGDGPSRQLVAHQCKAAVHAFVGCMPSLSSLLTRAAAASSAAAGTGSSSSAGSIIGSLVPTSFSPSRACCSSLETVDPTCLCTLASKAQHFFSSSSSSSSSSPARRGNNAGNTGQVFSAKDVKAAAFNLPSFCGLQPRFLPAA